MVYHVWLIGYDSDTNIVDFQSRTSALSYAEGKKNSGEYDIVFIEVGEGEGIITL